MNVSDSRHCEIFYDLTSKATCSDDKDGEVLETFKEFLRVDFVFGKRARVVKNGFEIGKDL
jgi:hypothetical protein